jgi:hypothetical protein
MNDEALITTRPVARFLRLNVAEGDASRQTLRNYLTPE